ncbi:RidA family protein [Escherichia coli]|nr:RidA family protein [Escherichia coli]EHU3918277.1 RidA family protein [Escherichia coli]EII8725072.1 RidA family protein [Escherichia coli]EJN5566951.1 RidA family protein [Escherichia coli]ELU1409058.1 RidA family protein [Escherichia coli]
MVERTAVFPASRHSLYAEHRYSAAIRSGDLLFVSGQVGSREDGTPEPDFQQQVRLAFDNLHATLAAAGCTFDDIIDVTSFHTDPEKQFEDIMTVKNEIFIAPPYPNWTAVGVTWLAGFDFEIKVIARIPEQ